MARIILILGLLCTPLISHHAFASFEFLPSSDDGSLALLKQLFGDFPCVWLESCTAGRNTTLFVELLGIVTGVLFLVAGGYYAINVLTGLGHTARTGRFLGNWDSLSMPFWTGASAIMIAPNPLLLGIAPIHALIMLITLLSTGPANLAWQSAIEYTGKGSVVVAHELGTVSEKSAEIPFTILKNEICTWTILKQVQQANKSTKHNIQIKDRQQLGYWGTNSGNPSASSKLKIYHRNISWGVTGFKNGICGSLFFPIRNETPNLDALQTLANSLQKHNALAINQLIKDIRKVAYSIVYSDMPGHLLSFSAQQQIMRKAINNYNNTQLEKTQELYRSQSELILKEFVDNAKHGGWIYAASWFWRMSDLQGRISNATRINNNTFEATTNIDIPENMAVILSDHYGRVEAIYDRISPTSGMRAEIRQMEKSGELDLFDRLGLRLGRAITGIVLSENENPLMSMKRVGDQLKTAGSALLGIGAASAAVPLVGNSAQFIAPIINFIAGLLITSGVILGQWIPMMPFITFFFAIAGWLLLVASAFIAASIWGFMHASPHGLTNVKPGYTFLIDLWLRPLLLVCGLITGYIVFIAMNSVLNDTLFKAIALSSFTSIWDALGNVIIYVVIQISLATLCFSFIWKIPASITNLYSGSSNVLVAPGSEQANNQIKQTSMVVAGIPSIGGNGTSGNKETPHLDAEQQQGTPSQNRSPEHYVSPEIDNRELLPQSHTHSAEQASTQTPNQQKQEKMNFDDTHDEYPSNASDSDQSDLNDTFSQYEASLSNNNQSELNDDTNNKDDEDDERGPAV